MQVKIETVPTVHRTVSRWCRKDFEMLEINEAKHLMCMKRLVVKGCSKINKCAKLFPFSCYFNSFC